MFENLGIIVKQKNRDFVAICGILHWLFDSIPIRTNANTLHLSHMPIQPLFHFIILHRRYCLAFFLFALLDSQGYLNGGVCLLLNDNAEKWWSRPMHVLKHFQSRLKFTFHYILSFYYTMYMYLSCIFFVGGGGWEWNH